MIRAIVADDSSLMRLILSDILNSDPEIQVIDTATDGKEAVAKVFEKEPDVLILDMTMGRYDGNYAVKNIMALKPLPILILSSLGNTHMEPILEALKLGALDYLNKPDRNKTEIRKLSREIILKVKSVVKNANTKLLKAQKNDKVRVNCARHTFSSSLLYDVIAIGSSTGGPNALERIITKLPENLPVPVLIAQHMPPGFVPSFVKRLDALTPLEISVARKGDLVEKGRIYVAPGSRNIEVIRNKAGKVELSYTMKKFKEYNHPSVDALLLSVAEVYKEKAIGVVLTGMGKDGAKGLHAIQKAGGYTVAQDKASSAVYGMPREVIEKGYARQVVSISEMGGFLVNCL